MGSIHLNPEAQRLLNTLKKYVPLLMLILIKAVYDHGAGIFYFTLLLITFIQSNNDLKKEIAKQQNRSWIALCGIFCYILACIFCVTVMLDERVFLPFAHPLTIGELLWSVMITDFMLKLITILLKVLLTCMPIKILALQKRVSTV